MPEQDPDELTLLDLAQWAYAADNDLDDIPLTGTEKTAIVSLFDEILADEWYADLYETEGITDPPSPTLPRIDLGKLQALRDKIYAAIGNLWERMKEAHKNAVKALIDSLVGSHPLTGGGGM